MENTNKKHKKVFLLCGIPGSGKSTLMHQIMRPVTDIAISRDNIRFLLLQEGEEYFAHEDKVREIFFNNIKRYTSQDEYENIYIDATHLTPKARKQVFQCINEGAYIIGINFNIPLHVALARNALRTGRALVPETAIYNMYKIYCPPSFEEGFDEIWHVDEQNNIRKELPINE